jgi:hypothetical protein
MSSATTLPLSPTAGESLRVKYPEPHPQIDNDVSGPQIQCLDNIGWTLPLVAFSFDRVQTRKSIKALVSYVDEEQDRNGTQKKKDKFDAIAQSARTSRRSGAPGFVFPVPSRFPPYFETGNF